MNKVIGIISYLPDDEKIRSVRIKKLQALISKCDEIFNLPIIIIAQNWKDDNIGSPNCEIYDYPKLGIAGARKELRRLFLNSGVDILIMLDDDCVILGDNDSANKYLREIDSHGEAFGEFKGTQLKLFSIHRNVLNKVDFVDINPELEEGFEDTIFVTTLEKEFPHKKFVFDFMNDLHETSVGVNDEYSTWYKNQNLKEMLRKTKEYGK